MKRLWQIARMGLWLGATVFGGVAAAYPRIRERCAALGEMTPADVDGLYALSVLLPGPSFLNLWGAISARAGGFVGAVVGQVALITPAFLIVLILPLASAIPWVASRGTGALNAATYATAGLLIATGVDGLRKQKGRALITGLALAGLVAGVHPVLLLIFALGWGAL